MNLNILKSHRFCWPTEKEWAKATPLDRAVHYYAVDSILKPKHS